LRVTRWFTYASRPAVARVRQQRQLAIIAHCGGGQARLFVAGESVADAHRTRSSKKCTEWNAEPHKRDFCVSFVD
jgi:hypothetical protein